ncbi:hypothetical protein SCB49_12344 [unidentified eubacterium SCB49]|nr:hypothetical protein SCB49_12344 [unidentified eubacterium SCB49]
MVVLVLFVQLVFLSLIIKEHYQTNKIVLISILFLILIFVISLKHLDLHHEAYAYEKLSVVIWVPVGAVVCYLLNVHYGLGSVIAAGIVGTIASFFPLINKKSDYLKQIPTSIYCGAFVGMSSTEISTSVSFALIAGIIAGIFLLLSKNLFIGVGGKLGTMAFLGVIIVYLLSISLA